VGKGLRDEDVMATASDTELALLLPELNADQTKVVVERILAIVSKVSVELGPESRNISLNGAAGIAHFGSWDQATTDILIDRARNALESMKESTYGRVVIAKEASTSPASETKKPEPQQVNTPLIAEPTPEVPSLLSEHPETAQVEDEQVEELVAVEESLESPEQDQNSEQADRVSVETSTSISRSQKDKKSHSHKLNGNGTGHGQLELSEQES
jgi:outer membrane biosynthesis protein TonB